MSQFVTSQINNEGVVYVGTEYQVSFKSNFVNDAGAEFWNNGDVHASKDWTNDGTVDFNVLSIDSGKTNFVGDDAQTISGTNNSNFYDVVFDNSFITTPAIDLQGDIAVTNESNFLNGIVTNNTSNAMFVFLQNADQNNASNASHVDGKVIKEGNTEFIYPIGNGEFFREATISQLDTTSDVLVGEFNFEDTNISFPTTSIANNLSLIDNTEHWVLEQVAGTSQVFLSIGWDSNTTQTEILTADPADIHIARWDAVALQWVDQGGLLDATNNRVSALVDNYGVFTLALKKEPVISSVPFPVNDAPDVFPLFVTPNQDGFNDTWNVNPTADMTVKSIFIFDRYGKLLKQLALNGAGWDGTYNDSPMPTNDYWYTVQYTISGETNVREYKSHFTLKR